MEKSAMNDVIDFKWSVPKGGYRWIETEIHDKGPHRASFVDMQRPKSRQQWVLTDDLADGLSYLAKEYAPLKSFTGLYRDFADLPRNDRDSILMFANEYGMLGVGQFTETPVETEGKNLVRTPVESWTSWKNEIREMHRAVSMWDMVRAKNSAGLSRRIIWKPGRQMWCYENDPDQADYWKMIEPVDNLFTPGNVLIPASFLVQRWVNKKLDGATSAQVLYDADRARRVLRIIPQNLLGAMWLQFAQTIDGNRQHQGCKHCNRWFEISSEETGFRVNRQFCSDACKSKDYRKRKASTAQAKIETTKKRTIKRKG
jgi:hypothetical protein